MSIHQTGPLAAWAKGVLVAGGIAAEVLKKPATIPTGAGWCVIYPVAGGVTSGSLEAPRSDATPNVQVTSFGADEDQAMWLADRVRSLLDAAVPATLGDGRSLIWVDFATAQPTITRDDVVQPNLFLGIDVIEFGSVA